MLCAGPCYALDLLNSGTAIVKPMLTTRVCGLCLPPDGPKPDCLRLTAQPVHPLVSLATRKGRAFCYTPVRDKCDLQ